MADKSAIEWTDATWNPTTGCDQISPGCANCYAKTWAARGLGNFAGGRPFEDVRVHDDRLESPLRWKKPRRIFVNSMSDLFHEAVPDAFIDRVFAVMALAPQHTFQILTKRAERMRDYMTTPMRGHRNIPIEIGNLRDRFKVPATWTWPHTNVWLGVSVENQHFAVERIPLLLQTPAAVRFISAEPLLGDIDLAKAHRTKVRLPNWPKPTRVDWVIVGGESGNSARPFDVAWARSIVSQCRAAGVPVFVKQLGTDPRDAGAERDDMASREAWPAGWMPTINGRRVWRPDLTDRKGGDMAEWPEDLRVREFPRIAVPT